MSTTVRQLTVYCALAVTTAALVAIAGLAAAPTAAGGQASAPEFAAAPASRRLVWFDRAGAMSVIPTPPRGYAYPRLAPDGRSAAIDIRDDRHGLWSWTIGGATLSPLSVGRASDIAPVWSHGGDRLLFSRGRGVAPGLFLLTPATGAVAAIPARSNSLLLPSALTPDDRLLLATVSVATGFDIVAIDIAGAGTTTTLVDDDADDLNPEVSPDGRWLAYQSRASGQFEIWLRRLSGGAASPVTRGGGTRPVWTRGGEELLYLTIDGAMMAMTVTAGAAPLPEVSPPRELFRAEIYRDLVGRTFDVTADGARVLAVWEPQATPTDSQGSR